LLIFGFVNALLHQPIATKGNSVLSAAFSVLPELIQSKHFDFVLDRLDSILCGWIDSNQTANKIVNVSVEIQTSFVRGRKHWS
jgi:hypothetical protein